MLKITPDDAEFWDSPGSVISYVKMAAAAVTGTRPDVGDNRKVVDVDADRTAGDPPITPGNPTEPPQEGPPGNPQPEVPPPVREPGEPPRPEELPGRTPDELPVRGPQGPPRRRLRPTPNHDAGCSAT